MSPCVKKIRTVDLPAVLSLINELALYEKAPDEVEMTLDQLQKDFETGCFDDLVVLENEQVLGFALYYFGYSTWKGKTLYLEDFVVSEEKRGRGIGKLLFEAIIQEAKQTSCKRMDWQVLDWNEPAINFYKKYDAKLEAGWLNGRFYAQDLECL